MIDMICLVQIDFWLTVWKFSVEIAQCGKMKNLVSPKNISSNQLFSNFYSKKVSFTKFLPKNFREINLHYNSLVKRLL